MNNLAIHNLQAEKGVLGSVLLVNDALDEVVGIVQGEHFYLDAHQKIFNCLFAMSKQGVNAFDALTVSEALEQRGELEEIGGVNYVIEILNAVPHAAHAKYYAEIVREASQKRRIMAACQDAMREVTDSGEDSDSILARLDAQFNGLLNRMGRQARPFAAIVPEFLEQLESQAIQRVRTGLVDFDRQFLGFPRGALTVLGARPGVGKTALCGVIATHAASAGMGVLFASLEQGDVEIVQRIIGGFAGVKAQDIRARSLASDDMVRLHEKSIDLQGIPLWIDDKTPMRIGELCSEVRLFKKRHNIAMVIVDYLQVITPDDRKIPREQQVADITRQLRNLAKNLDIAVVAIASLNRESESRDSRKPRISDLRESGSIESDADMILLLWRPGMTDEETPETEVVLMVEKNREGPRGEMKLFFDKDKMMYHAAATYSQAAADADFGGSFS